ncbi:serine/threonine-protein kinase [Sandaracinus amylolyticus]|uniref:serine/threonine-protein kinase n=1 Tax=Sandaracinus amylolyticus TaxID=927083 RepID=UPI001F2622AC|nr:serine/threonine-protein kinase [Sandaracinus amylolyticus]UJR81374.1 Serine/threonine protein kinase PrkC, regulator of stationary phase [Sandaracinus amylolyticus]
MSLEDAPSPQTPRTIADRIAGISSLAKTIERAPGATIRPDSPDTSLLDTLAPAIEAREGAAIRLGRTLGEGGMGVVREGVQVSLARRVAVKTLRDRDRDAGTQRATAKLLYEARVTGALEHPNVVPVHDIASDAQGTPLIVLKHIDGVVWSELLRDPERVARDHGATDPLEWHLRVLLQVCNAVHFAHTRGVLHRDLKPDNVMIGGFGEVYVLDWGLAVRTADQASATPKMDPAEGLVLAGTPWYMAPEMLGGAAARLSPATDVYLLGGVLHEIVTGRAPHQESNLHAILASVVQSRPHLDASVPEELAAIVRRALDPDPARRFGSADALRTAVEGFLRHRGAVQLAIEAERSLAALEEELAREDATPAREVIDRHFAECRFGFRAALRAWPEGTRAKEGLERAVSRMVAHELDAGRPHAAAALIGELDAPPRALASRVNDAVRAWDARQEALLRLDREHDPSLGRGLRLSITVFVGLFWTLGPVLAPYVDPTYGSSHASMTVLPVILTALVAVVAFSLRDRVLQTSFNRRLAAAFFLSQLGEIFIYVGGSAAQMTIAQCHAVVMLVASGTVGMLAAAVSRAFWIASLAFVVAFGVGSVWPQWIGIAEAIANAIITVTAIVLWSQRVPRPKRR